MNAILERDEETLAASCVCPACTGSMKTVSETLSEDIEEISPDCVVREVHALVRYACEPCGVRRVLVI